MDYALSSGKIYEREGFKYIKECFENGTLHLIGLLSDGGVSLIIRSVARVLYL